MSGPNHDDEAVTKLRGWNADVQRSGRFTPFMLISDGYTDSRGDVAAVWLTGAITGEHVEVLLSLRSCSWLCLTRCTFADPSLLPRLGGMRNLDSLMLLNNTVADQDLMRALPQFSNLRFLYLQDNEITDAIVGTIAALPKLLAVEIADTKITPAGVVRLKQLRPELRIDTTSPPPR